MVVGKHINQYYRKFALPIILGLIALGIVDFMQLKMPEFYQMVVNGVSYGYVMVDGVETVFDMQFLIRKICMPMVGVILTVIVGRFTWRVMLFGTAIRVEKDLRDRMFDNAKNLSREYYQVNKVGNLMSLFTNDLDTIQECFGWGVMMAFDSVVMFSMALTKMWRMDHKLTLLSTIPMFFLFLSATFVGKYMTVKWDYRQECFSRLSDFAQESFSGIAVIKAFVKEAVELNKFKALNIENEKANLAHTKASVLFRIMVMLFVESIICVILGYGGFLVYQDKFNAGQLVEFIGYFNSVIWPVMAVADLVDMTSRGVASAKRVGELLDAQQNVKDAPDAKPLEDIKGNIEFRNLSFQYPDGDYNVLENISFKINAGENVGLVGKTGSGKTTLVDLILRTYNVPDGTLFIDGHDVNDITIHSLRDGCAYVPQDNFLFSDTIENNIAFGVQAHSNTAVTNAAKLADIHSNIQDLSKGYGTVLGERGVTVSGGQKQRISIARALMKNAPILILDDSVSAVDTKTEKTILQNLHETRAGKTTILIAHRISTIEQMDKIIFIDDGKLVDMGRHEDLYKRCPAYKTMVDLQQLEEEGGNG